MAVILHRYSNADSLRLVSCENERNGKVCGKSTIWIVRPDSPAFCARERGSCYFCLADVAAAVQDDILERNRADILAGRTR